MIAEDGTHVLATANGGVPCIAGGYPDIPNLVVAPKLVTIKTTMIMTAMNAGMSSAIQRRISW